MTGSLIKLCVGMESVVDVVMRLQRENDELRRCLGDILIMITEKDASRKVIAYEDNLADSVFSAVGKLIEELDGIV